MRTVIIIPARLGSSRFPRKALAKIGGKSILQHAYETAGKSSLADGIFIATDSQEIADEVGSFGGKVIMTQNVHENGTSRVAEVAEYLSLAGTRRSRLSSNSIVVNFQVDEPFLPPERIDSLFPFGRRRIATLASSAAPQGWEDDRNSVGVVIGHRNRAIYFGREKLCGGFLHLGIYAYSFETLMDIAKIDSTPLAKRQNLEQLTWLDHGYPIHVELVSEAPQSINTVEDYEKLLETTGEAQSC